MRYKMMIKNRGQKGVKNRGQKVMFLGVKIDVKKVIKKWSKFDEKGGVKSGQNWVCQK